MSSSYYRRHFCRECRAWKPWHGPRCTSAASPTWDVWEAPIRTWPDELRQLELFPSRAV